MEYIILLSLSLYLSLTVSEETWRSRWNTCFKIHQEATQNQQDSDELQSMIQIVFFVAINNVVQYECVAE